MSQRQLGEPIELPWWVLPLLLPPVLVTLAGLVIPASLGTRSIAVVPALAMSLVVLRVATRVQSSSMQSVWISLAYGLWFIFPVTWVVALVSK